MSTTIRTTTKVTREFKLAIDNKELINVLRNLDPRIPDNAQIFIHVPGGGDWSNTCLNIDKACPIYITWATHGEEVS